MTKVEFNALEKVFAAEIEGRLLQSRARIYPQLVQQGLVAEFVTTLGVDHFGQITVSGWGLTHKGHIEFCAACAALLGDGEE